jgi:hypothetical protein
MSRTTILRTSPELVFDGKKPIGQLRTRSFSLVLGDIMKSEKS